MKVFELNRCEEYYMQQSEGLFISRERAISELKNVLLRVDYHTELEDYTILITEEGNENRKEIISRKEVLVTKDNLEEVLDGYGFYDLEHIDYGVYGVMSREVKE